MATGDGLSCFRLAGASGFEQAVFHHGRDDGFDLVGLSVHLLRCSADRRHRGLFAHGHQEHAEAVRLLSEPMNALRIWPGLGRGQIRSVRC